MMEEIHIELSDKNSRHSQYKGQTTLLGMKNIKR